VRFDEGPHNCIMTTKFH